MKNSKNKQSKINALRKRLKNLKSSPLYNFRVKNDYKPVLGEGSLNAKVMFIGEAPGKTEAETGRPFVGQAGQILDELLKEAGLKRKGVYITSILHDRPPGNRNPKPEEIEIYSPFLFKQIEIIRPKILVTLGNFGTKKVLSKFGLSEKIKPISKIHGNTFEAKAGFGKIKIMPMYHPAAILYNRRLESDVRRDFKKLKIS